MEVIKKLLSLMLALSLSVESIVPLSYAQVDADEDTVEVWENPPGTPPGVQCSKYEETPNSQNGVCCVGLEKNGASKCDTPPLKDPALTSCTSDANCSQGTGCYPQSGNDLYSPLSLGDDPEKFPEVESLLSDVEEVKGNGGACVHARDCYSYNCVSGVCKEKLVCRFADNDEVAPNGVLCGKGLVKKPNGVCEPDPNAANSIYLGLLDDVSVTTEGKQCQFELDQETKERSIVAMQSLRAMEWFFSTISLGQNEDCFNIVPTLKQGIGETIVDARKNILKNFNTQLNLIEDDYKKLINAKEDGTEILTIHGGERIKEGDLATRKTSGHDALMIMYRRNALFQSYEEAMLQTVAGAHAVLGPLETTMSAWKDGTQQPACEGSKYKTKKPLRSWKTKYWNATKDHWAVHYEVTGNASGNSDIVKRKRIATVLALIGGKDVVNQSNSGAVDAAVNETITEFTRPRHYLIDPMLFGGMSSGRYGTSKPLKKKSSFLGLFGGFKDLRKAYYIKGIGSGSYTYMHQELRPKLEEFYKTLRMDAAQKPFVYEPELLTIEAKDCLNNPEKPEKCAKFGSFLDDVHDEAFAYFLAWSYSGTDSYQGMFQDATSYRRRLLSKLMVDMQNITKYYQKLIELRTEQNVCIQKLITGLAASEILENGNSGVIEGNGNGSNVSGNQISSSQNINSGAKGNLIRSGLNSVASNKGAISPLNRGKFSFNLLNGTLKNLSNGTTLDNVIGSGNSSSGKASASDSGMAMLASRNKSMKDANAKAALKGVNVASKDKSVKEIMSSMARSSGLAGNKSSGGNGNMLASSAPATYIFNNGGNSTGPGTDSKSKGMGDFDLLGPGAGEIKIGGGKGSDNAATQGAGNGISETGLGVQSGEGAAGAAGDQNAVGNGEKVDSSGLSEADKDHIMVNYERNSSDYHTYDSDELFEKVSKAYVRNLNKVLIRKKGIKE